MFGRVQRKRHAHPRRELARPHPGADDDLLGSHLALVGQHTDGPAMLDQDALDLHIFRDVRTAGPRAFGKRHGHIGGIDLPVVWQPEAPDDVFRINQRPALLDLARRDDFDRQAEIAAHRGTALELLEPRLGVRGPQRAVLLKARCLPGLCLEPAEELARIFGELGHIAGRAELGDEAGRVPRRAAAELPALAQQDIGNAELRQVIGDRATGNTAPDDEDLYLARKISRHSVSDLIARRRNRPDHDRLRSAGIAIAMRQMAFEGETVTFLEHEVFVCDPHLEPSRDDYAGLLAAMGIRYVTARRAGRKRTAEQLELPVEIGRKKLVDDARAELELPPMPRADDDVAFDRRRFVARLEEPANRHAERPANSVEGIDRRAGYAALDLAQIADREPGCGAEVLQRDVARVPQRAYLAAHEDGVIVRFTRLDRCCLEIRGPQHSGKRHRPCASVSTQW